MQKASLFAFQVAVIAGAEADEAVAINGFSIRTNSSAHLSFYADSPTSLCRYAKLPPLRHSLHETPTIVC